MKIFGLIVAILIWLLTAFGCEPAKPSDISGEAPVTTVAPTKRPSNPTVTPKPTTPPSSSEKEDTLLPEI